MREKASKRQASSTEDKVVASQLNLNTYTFARISLIFKEDRSPLDANEFEHLLATAIKTVHGDFANQTNILKFTPEESGNYTAIIKFKTVHYTRVITGLLLYGSWRDNDCRFDIVKTAQTPCLLSF